MSYIVNNLDLNPLEREIIFMGPTKVQFNTDGLAMVKKLFCSFEKHSKQIYTYLVNT